MDDGAKTLEDALAMLQMAASGGTSDIIADMRALRDLGVAAIDIDFERVDPDESIAEMRRFQEQVISRV